MWHHGLMATLDPPLDVLRRQILDATELTFGEIGWIAGADHRQSGPHFPEYPAPAGNPPYEVDAIDVPHAPSRGADMAELTEALRLSRDPRIKLVIFNRRIFSSYDHAEGDPFTWRPYREEDPHTGHAHIERTDQRRDDLRPWQIGIDMALSDKQAKALEWYADFGDSRLEAEAVGSSTILRGPNKGAAHWGVTTLKGIVAQQAAILSAVNGVAAGVAGVKAAVVALGDDDELSAEDIETLADLLATKLPGDLAAQLAERLTLRFNSTPSAGL